MEKAVYRYSDFFNDDGGLQKAKDDFIKVGDQIIQKAKEIKKQSKFLNVENLSDIDKLEGKTQELVTAQNKHAASLKKIEALEKKLTSQRKASSKGITAQTEALKKQRAESRQIAKIQNTQSGSIENLRARLAIVTTAWTKLTQAEIENTKRGQRLNASKTQLTRTLQTLESKTGDNRRSVAAYSNALGGLRARFIGVAQAAGVTLGLFGAFRLLRNTISIVRDYEKANATLAGVLGITKDETQALRDQSQLLGSTTVRTAQQAVLAQTAYARLGFELKEIIDLTPATIDGSIALNAGLEETATLVGAVVNSYDDLSATDATQILETLAAGTTKSALSFEKLSVGLPIVLGAANALNIPLAEVTATLGKLSDAGIETSTGATSFRNILIEASKRGIDYKEALNEIVNSTDKLSTANAIFGKRAAVSALVVANNTKAVSELTGELENAQVVQQLVENELNTLDGSLKLLTSAWEGYVLSLNDASGGGNALSSVIRFLGENLTTIFRTIGIAASAWVSYTIAIRASAAATKAGIVIDRGATIATNFKTIATKAATAAQKAFNSASKANPIGILIALLAAAVTAYLAFRDATTAAEKAQKKFNESKDASFRIEERNIKAEREIQNERVKALEQEIAIRRAQGEQSEKLDKELAERKKAILLEEVENTQSIIENQQSLLDNEEKIAKERIANSEALNEGLRGKNLGRGKTDPIIDEINRDRRAAKALRETSAFRIGTIEARNAELASLNDQLAKVDDELAVRIAENSKKITKDQKDRIKELALLRRRLEDLQDQSIRQDEARERQITKRKFDREIAEIKGNSKIEIALRIELEKTKNRELLEISNKFNEDRLKSLKRIQSLELTFITDDTERRIAIEKEKSQKILDEIIANEVITEAKRRDLISEETFRTQSVIDQIKLDGQLKQVEDTRLINEAKLELSRSEFDKEEDFEKFKQARLTEINLIALKERLKLLEESGSDAFKVQIAQIKGQIAELENSFEKIEDPLKKLADAAKQIFSGVLNEIEKLQTKSVQSIKDALVEQEKAVDIQRRRAEEGLVNTLAFEQRELGKRESERIKAEKRLERIQKVRSLYSAYNNNAANENEKDPLGKTLRDFAILEAITASFADGGLTGIDGVKTDNFGITKGKRHDANGRGGNLAWHEVGEGFFNRKEVDSMGRENFYKLKNLASAGQIDDNFFSKQRELFVQSVPVVGGSPELLNEMREVKKAINGKPTQNWDAIGVIDGVLEVVETTMKKNKVRRNHYKSKRPQL